MNNWERCSDCSSEFGYHHLCQGYNCSCKDCKKEYPKTERVKHEHIPNKKENVDFCRICNVRIIKAERDKK